ncbi:MAG: ATP-binding cassette domain-containing protein, partial [Bacteroidales bacterium]|nr:ATP-binding cassette domain-containing protein [Bacteroidales bacterium]
MFILHNISYIHIDKELLFDNINLSLNPKEKIAVIGNNGVGKSTLLKIIAGQIPPSAGNISRTSTPYYVPQIVGQFDNLTVAQAIGISERLIALSGILSGNVTEENLSALNDDWTMEERCKDALSYWQLDDLDLNLEMRMLSGGQKTKVFLAGINIHNPDIVLLDEPTNHLDFRARNILYQFIQETSCSLVAVSHDRNLLNILDKMCELNRHEIKIYGGNYDFYKEQKNLENAALVNHLEETQKSLRKAKATERETLERQQKRESHGKKNLKKSNIPAILAGGRKNNAENTTAKMKGVHTRKINAIEQELGCLRKEIPDRDKMKFGFDGSTLHKGKILVAAKGINYAYHENLLWENPLDFQIVSGERIAIKGENGTGKTTLIRLISGEREPTCGSLFRADNKILYIDQEYSLISSRLNVYEQTQAFNNSALQESEIKTRLNRFLFSKDVWNKPCAVLSGGEKMRLLLCCLTVTTQSPDIIFLDEPTNNIDIQNVEILTEAIDEYQGTLIVVSHDQYFLKQIH